MSLVLVMPYLGLFSLMPTFSLRDFFTTILLLLLCLFLPLASPLLIPCARYIVLNTHPMHKIPTSYCLC